MVRTEIGLTCQVKEVKRQQTILLPADTTKLRDISETDECAVNLNAQSL